MVITWWWWWWNWFYLKSGEEKRELGKKCFFFLLLLVNVQSKRSLVRSSSNNALASAVEENDGFWVQSKLWPRGQTQRFRCKGITNNISDDKIIPLCFVQLPFITAKLSRIKQLEKLRNIFYLTFSRFSSSHGIRRSRDLASSFLEEPCEIRFFATLKNIDHYVVFWALHPRIIRLLLIVSRVSFVLMFGFVLESSL